MLRAFEVFGPAEKLYAAVRRRAPQIGVAIDSDEDSGLSSVRCTYRDAGPRAVAWDGTAYRWHVGPDRGRPLPGDPEEAADVIAEALGAGSPAPPEQ